MRLHRQTSRTSSAARFAIAGCLNTAVSYLAFVICFSSIRAHEGLDAVAISVAMSLLAGITVSYNLQKYFVWGPFRPNDRRSAAINRAGNGVYNNWIQKSPRKVVYAGYYLLLAGINIVVVGVIEEKTLIDPRIGQAFFTVVSAACSYFVLRYLFANKVR